MFQGSSYNYSLKAFDEGLLDLYDEQFSYNSFKELIHNKSEESHKVIRNIKPSKVSTTSKPVTVSRIQSDSKFDDFNTESYLHSLGYKVGKTGLSKAQRRNLLKKAIEGGRITKYDVIETLERNISMFHRRGNMQQAVNDWLDDLSYVRSNF